MYGAAMLHGFRFVLVLATLVSLLAGCKPEEKPETQRAKSEVQQPVLLRSVAEKPGPGAPETTEIAALMGGDAVTSESVWAFLLEKYPLLAEGDHAILQSFDAILQESTDEKHRRALAICLVGKMTDPTLAIPLNDRFQDSLSQTLFLSAIVRSATEDKFSVVVDFLDTKASDKQRKDLGTQLMSRIPADKPEQVFDLIEKLRPTQKDLQQYEFSYAARLAALLEKADPAVTPELLRTIMDKMSESGRLQLGSQVAISKLDLKDPQSLQAVSEEWGVDPGNLFIQASSSPSFAEAVVNGDIHLNQLPSWTGSLADNDPLLFPVIGSILTPFVGLQEDGSFTALLDSLPTGKKTTYAQALGKAYSESLGAERTAKLRAQIPSDYLKSFDLGVANSVKK
jgi:hypothetical protein